MLRFRRSVAVAAALTCGLMALGVGPAAADIDTYADSTAEPGTSPATDATQLRVSYDATSFDLELWFRGADASSFAATNLLFYLETTNDPSHTPDFAVSRDAASPDSWDVSPAQQSWSMDPPPGPGCTVPGTFDGHLSITIPTSCLVAPPSVRVSVYLSGPGGTDAMPDPRLGMAGSFLPWLPPVSIGPDVEPTTTPQVVVYRFWSIAFGNAHFFTAVDQEAGDVARNDSNWRYEGPAFTAIAAQGGTCSEGTPVYRFWSPYYHSHFYTASAQEKDDIRAHDPHWWYEETAYCAVPDDTPGSVPLYRFWSPVFGKHFFTADAAEATYLQEHDANWTYEGVAYRVLPPPVSLGAP